MRAPTRLGVPIAGAVLVALCFGRLDEPAVSASAPIAVTPAAIEGPDARPAGRSAVVETASSQRDWQRDHRARTRDVVEQCGTPLEVACDGAACVSAGTMQRGFMGLGLLWQRPMLVVEDFAAFRLGVSRDALPCNRTVEALRDGGWTWSEVGPDGAQQHCIGQVRGATELDEATIDARLRPLCEALLARQ